MVKQTVQGRRTPERVVRRHVEAQQSSGLSIAAYCRGHGLSSWTFYEWRKRCGQQPRQAVKPTGLSFVELPLGASGHAFELSLGEGLTLRFGRASTPLEIRDLVAALRGIGRA
jgi:hypothetical protein